MRLNVYYISNAWFAVVALAFSCSLELRVHGLQQTTKSARPSQSRFQIRHRIKRAASKVYHPIHNKFWPNTLPDPTVQEKLPPGPLGCPFRGFDPKESNPSFGPGVLYFRLFEKLKRPTVFKFFSPSKPIAIVQGVATSKAMLAKEFDTITSQAVPFSQKIIGANSLRCSSDKKEHAQLRKLVGMAMQPSKVSKLIPDLYETADALFEDVFDLNDKADGSSKQDSLEVAIEKVTMRFTFLVACRHIIGLNEELLPMDEFPEFLQQAEQWIFGIFSSGKGDESWKPARSYLVDKIVQKIEWLNEHGPDESTVSGMLFAEDEDNQRRLSQDEIIDNTLLLILAGSETSAGTLVNCILLLGLDQHKQERTKESIMNKLIQEQESLMQKFGPDTLNRTVLDQSVYTEGVVKESLRLRPVVGGSFRGATSTTVLDGYQIPAGWGVTFDRYNTHLMDPVTQMPDNAHMDVAEGFDPTRWFLEERQPKEFIPFGAGYRYCIGSNLAMCEMQVFLIALARRMPKWEMLSPKVERSASEIQWKERAIIPVPRDGVVIRPKRYD